MIQALVLYVTLVHYVPITCVHSRVGIERGCIILASIQENILRPENNGLFPALKDGLDFIVAQTRNSWNCSSSYLGH